MEASLLLGVYTLSFLLHLAVAGVVWFTAPRRASNGLAAIILALTGGALFARILEMGFGGESGDAFVGAQGRVTWALEWGVSFLVLALALRYPIDRARHGRGRTFFFVLLGACLLLWSVAYAIRLIPTPTVLDGHTVRGWSMVTSDHIRYYGTMVPALALFGSAYIRLRPDEGGRAAEYLFVGLASGVLSFASFGILGYGNAFLDRARADHLDAGAWSFFVTALGSLSVVFLFLAVVFLGWRKGRRLRVVGGLGSLILVVGLVAWFDAQSAARFPPIFRNFGEFGYLVLRPLFLGYAILRHQLFDIDIRVNTGIRRTTIVAAFAVPFFVMSELAEAFLPVEGTWIGIAAAGAVTLALHPVQRMARGLADRLVPVTADDPAYVLHKKREVYRYTIESSLRDGVIDVEERALLERMQLRLGLDPDDANDIEHAVLRASGLTA